jgi:hypothetical protein
MDAGTVRAMLEQHFATSDPDLSHAMYHDDAVLEFPQSGERCVGVETSANGEANWLALAVFGEQLYAGGSFTSAGGDSQARSTASYSLRPATPLQPVDRTTPSSQRLQTLAEGVQAAGVQGEHRVPQGHDSALHAF